jgi:hypothetical protein
MIDPRLSTGASRGHDAHVSWRTALLSIGALGAACAADPDPSWKIHRAEQLHTEGATRRRSG